MAVATALFDEQSAGPLPDPVKGLPEIGAAFVHPPDLLTGFHVVPQLLQEINSQGSDLVFAVSSVEGADGIAVLNLGLLVIGAESSFSNSNSEAPLQLSAPLCNAHGELGSEGGWTGGPGNLSW